LCLERAREIDIDREQQHGLSLHAGTCVLSTAPLFFSPPFNPSIERGCSFAKACRALQEHRLSFSALACHERKELLFPPFPTSSSPDTPVIFRRSYQLFSKQDGGGAAGEPRAMQHLCRPRCNAEENAAAFAMQWLSSCPIQTCTATTWSISPLCLTFRRALAAEFVKSKQRISSAPPAVHKSAATVGRRLRRGGGSSLCRRNSSGHAAALEAARRGRKKSSVVAIALVVVVAGGSAVACGVVGRALGKQHATHTLD
jgi:hypothetical protein